MATTPAKRACSVCGTLLADDSAYCPVCALQQAFGTQTYSVWNTSSALRFEHYTVLQNAEGKPFELGHGGMGVTYKAFDVHLQRPAALKIINAQLLGNEPARARFIREARAAASVRHQNVASVFHIGETGGNYYYAMELVEGESLAVDDDENEVTEQPLSNLSDLPDNAEGLLLACHGQGTAGRKLISTASERRIPFVCRRRKRPLSQDGEAGR